LRPQRQRKPRASENKPFTSTACSTRELASGDATSSFAFKREVCPLQLAVTVSTCTLEGSRVNDYFVVVFCRIVLSFSSTSTGKGSCSLTLLHVRGESSGITVRKWFPLKYTQILVGPKRGDEDYYLSFSLTPSNAAFLATLTKFSVLLGQFPWSCGPALSFSRAIS
jgi:hypothetical protein